MSESMEVGQEEVSVAEVPGVGARLRAAREARQWQVTDIAQTLKLGPRQVEALESGNWAALPGNTFIRGFVRNYARLVNIEVQPLMQLLDEQLERPVNSLALPETKPAAMPMGTSVSGRRDRAVMIAGGGLVLAALLLYLALPSDLVAWRESVQGWLDSLARKENVLPAQNAPDPVFPPGATPQQVMNPQAVNGTENAQQPPATVVESPAVVQGGVIGKPALRFVVDKESWIEVRDRSDSVVFSQRAVSGSEQAVDGQGPLSLVIGFAPGVKLYWRGQVVDLAPHTKGDVARLVLE